MSKRHRSARSGRFTTAKYAKRHPMTTVAETVKPRRKKSTSARRPNGRACG